MSLSLHSPLWDELYAHKADADRSLLVYTPPKQKKKQPPVTLRLFKSNEARNAYLLSYKLFLEKLTSVTAGVDQSLFLQDFSGNAKFRNLVDVFAKLVPRPLEIKSQPAPIELDTNYELYSYGFVNSVLADCSSASTLPTLQLLKLDPFVSEVGGGGGGAAQIIYDERKSVSFAGTVGGSLASCFTRFYNQDALFYQSFRAMVQTLVPLFIMIRASVAMKIPIGCIHANNIVQYISNDELKIVSVDVPSTKKLGDTKHKLKFFIADDYISSLTPSMSRYYTWSFAKSKEARFTFFELRAMVDVSKFGRVKDFKTVGESVELEYLILDFQKKYPHSAADLLGEQVGELGADAWNNWRLRVNFSCLETDEYVRLLMNDPLSVPFYFHPYGGYRFQRQTTVTNNDVKLHIIGTMVNGFWTDMLDLMRLDLARFVSSSGAALQKADPELFNDVVQFESNLLGLWLQVPTDGGDTATHVLYLDEWPMVHQFLMAALGDEYAPTKEELQKQLLLKVDVYATGTILARLLYQSAHIERNRSLSSVMLLQLVIMVCLFPGPVDTFQFDWLMKQFFIGSNEPDSQICLRWNDPQLGPLSIAGDLLCKTYREVANTIKLRMNLLSRFYGQADKSIRELRLLSHLVNELPVRTFLKETKPAFYKEQKQRLDELRRKTGRDSLLLGLSTIDKELSSDIRFRQDLQSSIQRQAKTYSQLYQDRGNARVASDTLPKETVGSVNDDDPLLKDVHALQRMHFKAFQIPQTIYSNEAYIVRTEKINILSDLLRRILLPFFHNPFLEDKQLMAKFMDSSDKRKSERMFAFQSTFATRDVKSFLMPLNNKVDEAFDKFVNTFIPPNDFNRLDNQFDNLVYEENVLSPKMNFVASLIKVVADNLGFNWALFTISPSSANSVDARGLAFTYQMREVSQSTNVSRRLIYLYEPTGGTKMEGDQLSFLYLYEDMQTFSWLQWTARNAYLKLLTNDVGTPDLSALLRNDRLADEIFHYFPVNASGMLDSKFVSLAVEDIGMHYDMVSNMFSEECWFLAGEDVINLEKPISASGSAPPVPKLLTVEDYYKFLAKYVYNVDIPSTGLAANDVFGTEAQLDQGNDIIAALGSKINRPIIIYKFLNEASDIQFETARYPVPIYWTNCTLDAKFMNEDSLKLKYSLNIVVNDEETKIMNIMYPKTFFQYKQENSGPLPIEKSKITYEFQFEKDVPSAVKRGGAKKQPTPETVVDLMCNPELTFLQQTPTPGNQELYSLFLPFYFLLDAQQNDSLDVFSTLQKVLDPKKFSLSLQSTFVLLVYHCLFANSPINIPKDVSMFYPFTNSRFLFHQLYPSETTTGPTFLEDFRKYNNETDFQDVMDSLGKISKGAPNEKNQYNHVKSLLMNFASHIGNSTDATSQRSTDLKDLEAAHPYMKQVHDHTKCIPYLARILNYKEKNKADFSDFYDQELQDEMSTLILRVKSFTTATASDVEKQRLFEYFKMNFFPCLDLVADCVEKENFLETLCAYLFYHRLETNAPNAAAAPPLLSKTIFVPVLSFKNAEQTETNLTSKKLTLTSYDSNTNKLQVNDDDANTTMEIDLDGLKGAFSQLMIQPNWTPFFLRVDSTSTIPVEPQPTATGAPAAPSLEFQHFTPVRENTYLSEMLQGFFLVGDAKADAPTTFSEAVQKIIEAVSQHFSSKPENTNLFKWAETLNSLKNLFLEITWEQAVYYMSWKEARTFDVIRPRTLAITTPDEYKCLRLTNDHCFRALILKVAFESDSDQVFSWIKSLTAEMFGNTIQESNDKLLKEDYWLRYQLSALQIQCNLIADRDLLQNAKQYFEDDLQAVCFQVAARTALFSKTRTSLWPIGVSRTLCTKEMDLTNEFTPFEWASNHVAHSCYQVAGKNFQNNNPPPVLSANEYVDWAAAQPGSVDASYTTYTDFASNQKLNMSENFTCLLILSAKLYSLAKGVQSTTLEPFFTFWQVQIALRKWMSPFNVYDDKYSTTFYKDDWCSVLFLLRFRAFEKSGDTIMKFVQNSKFTPLFEQYNKGIVDKYTEHNKQSATETDDNVRDRNMQIYENYRNILTLRKFIDEGKLTCQNPSTTTNAPAINAAASSTSNWEDYLHFSLNDPNLPLNSEPLGQGVSSTAATADEALFLNNFKFDLNQKVQTFGDGNSNSFFAAGTTDRQQFESMIRLYQRTNTTAQAKKQSNLLPYVIEYVDNEGLNRMFIPKDIIDYVNEVQDILVKIRQNSSSALLMNSLRHMKAQASDALGQAGVKVRDGLSSAATVTGKSLSTAATSTGKAVASAVSTGKVQAAAAGLALGIVAPVQAVLPAAGLAVSSAVTLAALPPGALAYLAYLGYEGINSRFKASSDFSSLSQAELQKVQSLINSKIQEEDAIEQKILSIEKVSGDEAQFIARQEKSAFNNLASAPKTADDPTDVLQRLHELRLKKWKEFEETQQRKNGPKNTRS